MRSALPPLPRTTVTSGGREALARILAYLRLRANDEVWITTTLGLRDLQISPCVTGTIARYCRFAAQPGPRTAAVLVIHDYGVAHPRLAALRDQCRRHGWPLIEDAAHAFASTDSTGRRMGTLADFALFSLPKFFALPHGGLVSGLPSQATDGADEETAARLCAVLPHAGAIAETRCQNWLALDALMHQGGLESALPLTAGSVPSVYVLRTERQFATLRRLRKEGIESGPEVHCARLLLPCHQSVSSDDLRRIAAIVAEPGARHDHAALSDPQDPTNRPRRRLRLAP
jgi:hypothetical protein